MYQVEQYLERNDDFSSMSSCFISTTTTTTTYLFRCKSCSKLIKIETC